MNKNKEAGTASQLNDFAMSKPLKVVCRALMRALPKQFLGFEQKTKIDYQLE